jgi:hypothetical protein
LRTYFALKSNFVLTKSILGVNYYSWTLDLEGLT